MPMPQDFVSTLQPVTREKIIYIWRELMDTLRGWDIVSRLSTFLKELINSKFTPIQDKQISRHH